jgi:hypothetical protein
MKIHPIGALLCSGALVLTLNTGAFAQSMFPLGQLTVGALAYGTKKPPKKSTARGALTVGALAYSARTKKNPKVGGSSTRIRDARGPVRIGGRR